MPVDVTADQVLQQVERILSSRTARLTSRCNSLLLHLAEKTLLGQADELKERAIGVAVYHKDQSFDPRLDAIVRVGVRALRRKLDEYYREEARPTELRIRCRTGGYALQFGWPASDARTTGAGRQQDK